MKLDTLRKIDIFLQGLNVCCIIASVICGCHGVSTCLEAGNINAAAKLLIISGALVCVSGDSADGYIIAAKGTGIGCAFLIPPILYKRFANEDKGQPYGGVPVLCIVAFIMLCGIASVFLSQGFIKTATALYLIACIPLFIMGWIFVKAVEQGADGLVSSIFPWLSEKKKSQLK